MGDGSAAAKVSISSTVDQTAFANDMRDDKTPSSTSAGSSSAQRSVGFQPFVEAFLNRVWTPTSFRSAASAILTRRSSPTHCARRAIPNSPLKIAGVVDQRLHHLEIAVFAALVRVD